jgi:Fe-S-cluster-containing dehydrogenase component
MSATTKRYGLLIQNDKCIGCSVCTISCKDEFIGNAYTGYNAAQPSPAYGYNPSDWPSQAPSLTLWYSPGQNWINYGKQIAGTYPAVNSKFVYTPCMHCDNAPCVAAAKNNAVYTRPDGIVLIDPAKSSGQSTLPASCPYGVIYWNSAQNIAQKCTLCAHLVDQGQNPRCVDSCPQQVILFGDLNDPTSAISQQIAATKAQPLHPEYGTKPKVYYTVLQ